MRLPPYRALLKYKARLDRAEAILPDPAALAFGRKHPYRPSVEDRKAYAAELELVLRDYRRLLDDVMSRDDGELMPLSPVGPSPFRQMPG